DESQIATAATNLSSVTASLGQLPEALRLRQRAEQIHRRLNAKGQLPFDLTQRADLLIRLGRSREADTALAEIDAVGDAGIEAYKGRARRAIFVRALEAVTALRCNVALERLDEFAKQGTPAGTPKVLAPALRSFCSARLGRRETRDLTSIKDAEPIQAAEAYYWLAAGDLEREDPALALNEARYGLTL